MFNLNQPSYGQLPQTQPSVDGDNTPSPATGGAALAGLMQRMGAGNTGQLAGSGPLFPKQAQASPTFNSNPQLFQQLMQRLGGLGQARTQVMPQQPLGGSY